jgi:hypothetical protein
LDEGLEHTRRARLRALLVLALVLVVGMLLGAAEERYRQQLATGTTASAGEREHPYPGALGHMDLTASQRAAIDSLLDLERPHNEEIMARVIPELRAEADSLRAAIRPILTPAQQQLFDREPRAQGGELVRRFGKAMAPRDTTP